MTDNRKKSGNTPSPARRTGSGGKRAYVANARDSAAARRGKAPAPARNTGSHTGSRSSSGSGTGRSRAAAPSRRRNTYEDDGQLKFRFEEDDSLKDEITIILILLAGVLMVLSYFHLCGSFGELLTKVIF
ncbi:MAG: hypothetical protein J6X17_03415, partial [Lachnospiraceae bacterium]|nr:hypothetical protein [Lachnospiraceae bacterium]